MEIRIDHGVLQSQVPGQHRTIERFGVDQVLARGHALHPVAGSVRPRRVDAGQSADVVERIYVDRADERARNPGPARGSDHANERAVGIRLTRGRVNGPGKRHVVGAQPGLEVALRRRALVHGCAEEDRVVHPQGVAQLVGGGAFEIVGVTRQIGGPGLGGIEDDVRVDDFARLRVEDRPGDRQRARLRHLSMFWGVSEDEDVLTFVGVVGRAGHLQGREADGGAGHVAPTRDRGGQRALRITVAGDDGPAIAVGHPRRRLVVDQELDILEIRPLQRRPGLCGGPDVAQQRARGGQSQSRQNRDGDAPHAIALLQPGCAAAL